MQIINKIYVNEVKLFPKKDMNVVKWLENLQHMKVKYMSMGLGTCSCTFHFKTFLE